MFILTRLFESYVCAVQGVAIPSQKRYVDYYARILNDQPPARPKVCQATAVLCTPSLPPLCTPSLPPL